MAQDENRGTYLEQKRAKWACIDEQLTAQAKARDANRLAGRFVRRQTTPVYNLDLDSSDTPAVTAWRAHVKYCPQCQASGERCASGAHLAAAIKNE